MQAEPLTSVTLTDHCTKDRPVRITVCREQGSAALTLDCQGHGHMTMEPGFGDIILLEVHEGKLRMLVWGDINEEDPTHIIDLSNALESNRKEQ